MGYIEHLVLLTSDHETEHLKENITWGFHRTYSILV